MSIPRVIHYCWFGGNPKPELLKKCIKSWEKFCPSYKIMEWNESNFDVSSCPLYVRQAYEEKKWAFVSDYVRLKIVYDEGGIYLDTDVELKKCLDKMLFNKAFFGFEDGKNVATGLGFGAEKHTPILKELMDDYNDIAFVLPDGSHNNETCPIRNTKIFLKHGLKQNDQLQILDGEIKILPSIYMCPISYNTGRYRHSLKTISVHWFSSSWMDERQKRDHETRKKILRKNSVKDFWLHFPNRIAIRLLGKVRYEKLKSAIKVEKNDFN